MGDQTELPHVIRFGVFEVDLRVGELRKQGLKLKLQGQPFQILALLLERAGEIVTREEIQSRLWPGGTVVAFDQSVGTAIRKLRQTLGDDADTPRYIETVPRRGYRFIAPLTQTQVSPLPKPRQHLPVAAFILGLAVLAVVILLEYRRPPPAPPHQRGLTRLTFDSGLQCGATWSPDGRFLAYSGDRGGKFDIWVQQVGRTNPVRVTSRAGHNWQPDWSPDGNWIVFRGEGEGSGLFVVPALGGPERRITSFGYRPRWSLDGRQILFGNTLVSWFNKLYVVGFDGGPAHEILTEFLKRARIGARSAAWVPGGNGLSIWGYADQGKVFWTVSQDGTNAAEYKASAAVHEKLSNLTQHERMQYRWAPSGRAIYFDGELNGVCSLWKLAVDTHAKRFTSLERLTNGPGPDTDLAISADGKRLAYTARVERVRVWTYPFDAISGRQLGDGKAVTPAGLDAWQADISRDGKKLVYVGRRVGKPELWEKSLPEGPDTQLAVGDDFPVGPRWSPDASRLAFTAQGEDGRLQIFTLTEAGRKMDEITSESFHGLFYDWSPDGQSIVVNRIREHQTDGVNENSVLLLAARPGSEITARPVTAPRHDYLDEIRMSPNGRWLVFLGAKGGLGPSGAGNATLYVVAVSGGPWIPITDSNSWDDKPRWSPDGKTIYFVSARSGFLNVWGNRFDSEKGCPVGHAFQVTSFENPGFMFTELDLNSMALSSHRLALSMNESSGSVDRKS